MRKKEAAEKKSDAETFEYAKCGSSSVRWSLGNFFYRCSWLHAWGLRLAYKFLLSFYLSIHSCACSTWVSWFYMQMKTCLLRCSAQRCVKHQKDSNCSETNPSSDTINKHERFDEVDGDDDDDKNGIFTTSTTEIELKCQRTVMII